MEWVLKENVERDKFIKLNKPNGPKRKKRDFFEDKINLFEMK